MTTKQLTEVDVTWMKRQDVEAVMWIENSSFQYPWTVNEMMSCLRQSNCIGMVAKRDNVIAGFVVYELLKSQIHILNIAVHQEFRRQQIGSQMLDKIAFKLIQQKRNESIVHVREVNLAAQKFFAANGYLAECIVPEFYDDPVEDAIRFYRMRDE